MIQTFFQVLLIITTLDASVQSNPQSLNARWIGTYVKNEKTIFTISPLLLQHTAALTHTRLATKYKLMVNTSW